MAPILTTSKTFEISADELGDRLRIRFSGGLDEDVPFGIVFKSIGDALPRLARIELDLGDVREINSFGLRGWLHFLGCIHALHDKIPYSFPRISGIFIERAAMFDGLLGHEDAPIGEILAEYFCASCNRSLDYVLNHGNCQLKDGIFVPPTVQCSTCSKPMEFAGIEANYVKIFPRLKGA